jgi:rhodanese-related sulfurtransferase
MKLKNLAILFLIAMFFLNSCKQNIVPGEGINIVEDSKIDIPEIEAVTDFLINSGDYINSKQMPSMVSAEDVNDNLSKYFVIDVRRPEDYAAGHINGAVNIAVNNLLAYLDEFVAPSVYDKVVIVDKTGMEASYVVSVLRLIGYSNAYAMKYGMGAWNRIFDAWSENISGKYSNQLETNSNSQDKIYPLPTLHTEAHCGAEILQARAKTVLNTPFERLTISVDRVFANPQDFYIINYWKKEDYNKGHIPTAHQYTPREDIKKSKRLKNIPTDKKVVVYCYTGQSAAFLMAYLRMLGYNAFIIPYGANSFMYDKVIANAWHAFKASEKLNDFLIIKGEKPMGKDFNKQILKLGTDVPAKKKKKIKRRKKKEVEGGCG